MRSTLLKSHQLLYHNTRRILTSTKYSPLLYAISVQHSRFTSTSASAQTQQQQQQQESKSASQTDLIVFDGRDSFNSKSTKEIFRAWLVFEFCRIQPLVKHSQKLFTSSQAVLGESLSNWIMKQTFFGHFCGGEDKLSILPTIDKLEKSGIHAILDYAAEGDVSSAEETLSAYSGEAKCDATLKICLDCIEAAAQRPDGFAAIKLTGLGNPDLLSRISEIITRMRNIFSEMFETSNSQKNTKGKSAGVYSGILTDSKFANQHHLNRALNFEEFKEGIERAGLVVNDENILKNIFDKMDNVHDGRIDFLEWIEFIQPTEVTYRPFFVNEYSGETPLTQLTVSEVEQLDRLVGRLYKLADTAKRLKVRLMVDAEHTYFQPAIDHFVLHLQRKYNSDFPTIFNTYQTYLRDSYVRISIDIERANKENFYFAAKIVRGAYMNVEKQRAKERGEEDPIHYNKLKTDENYNRGVDTVLQKSKKFSVMVASHNEKSILHTIKRMKEFNIPKSGQIFFGQLLGMCDHITYALAANGYSVRKYVPFGPVHEVIPYLVRRAEENSSLMAGASKERSMLRREIRRRLIGI